MKRNGGMAGLGTPDDRTGLFSLCMLASGSRGNAIYLSDGATRLLIDAGLSGKEIERRLHSRGLNAAALDALVVSHEHADHIQGVGVLSRKYGLPVYINEKTYDAAPRLGKVADLRKFCCSAPFMINDIRIHPFPISHDAADPAGFTLKRGTTKIGIATDLGIATALVKERLKGCAMLVLEANHDPKMLVEGPYPWPLKQRIRGRTGHLANEDTRNLLQELQHDGLQHVILAHLSDTNNTPEKAYATVRPALDCCCPNLSVALQATCGELMTVCESDRK